MAATGAFLPTNSLGWGCVRVGGFDSPVDLKMPTRHKCALCEHASVFLLYAASPADELSRSRGRSALHWVAYTAPMYGTCADHLGAAINLDQMHDAATSGYVVVVQDA